MKDIRHGEHLWMLWEGEGFQRYYDNELVYFTIGHVDIEDNIVRRALASVLQRDGLADALSDGFRLLESAVGRWEHAGILPEEQDYIFCDSLGVTDHGDQVEDALEVSWVKIII